jgi:hypothetical protein
MIRSIALTCGLAFGIAAVLAAVDTTGKRPVALSHLPQDIVERIEERYPGFHAEAAEYEVRNGKEYYDVEGTGADGTEVEFDLTELDGQWTIVETQRDIDPAAAPAAVRDRLAEAYPDFRPRRVIESDQGGGIIIYEYFGSIAQGPETKLEVRFEKGAAELLQEEWVH